MTSATWIVTPDKFLNGDQVTTLRVAMEAERRRGD